MQGKYIQRIEIDALWSGQRHVVWTLRPDVNILSGVNGVGKSTILNWQISRAVNRYRLPVIVCYVGLEQVNEKTIRNFWAWLPNKIRKYIGRDSARMCHIPLTKDKLERALGAFSVNNGTYPWNSTTIF